MGTKKDPTNHISVGAVRSGNDPNLSYTIGIDRELSEKFGHVHFTCTCTSFKFSGRGGIERKCKHTIDFCNDSFIRSIPFFMTPDGSKSIEDIVGNTVEIKRESSRGTSGLNYIWKLTPKLVVPPFIQMIGNLLTEITCPFIMCRHVMQGKFSPYGICTCEKCSKEFIPE